MAKSEMKSLMQYLDQLAKWNLLTTHHFWGKISETIRDNQIESKHGRVKSGYTLYYLGTLWLLFV